MRISFIYDTFILNIMLMIAYYVHYAPNESVESYTAYIYNRKDWNIIY